MKIIIFLLFIMSPLFQNLETIDSDFVFIEIKNLKNTQGQICILVFSEEKGYPEDFNLAFKSKIISASKISKPILLEDLPKGNFVITILHDENSNNVMDKNIFGKPVEGYGVSNNPPANTFGPPDFDRGIIQQNIGHQNLEIHIKY